MFMARNGNPRKFNVFKFNDLKAIIQIKKFLSIVIHSVALAADF